MQRGEMVVLSSGDLARAMRASMAVPGVFAPVTIDGRILGDGGLTRNVPVDIARETCADVVIAAAVPNPTPELDDLSSPLTLVARTLDVLIGANERQQLETLGPQDVKIVIDMGDIGSASFDRVADAIPLGRTATLAHRAELERYALPETEYRAWRLARSRPPREQMSLAGVTVQGAQRVNEEFVQHTLGLQAGDVVDSAEIAGAHQPGVRAVGLRGGRLQPVRRPAAPDPRRRPAREVLGTQHPALRPRASTSAPTRTPRSRSAATSCAPGSTTAAGRSTARCASGAPRGSTWP